jgi:hypothetical protein
MGTAIDVTLEVGTKRVFASAVEWPGWCRSGRGEEAALAALADAADRYRVVTARAGVRLPADAGASFRVIERVAGDATTDFGAPGKATEADRAPLTAGQAKRRAALVAAAWSVFDEVVAGAPAALRKGPRGGGRDRDKMVAHVYAAEAAYARKLGVKLSTPQTPAEVSAQHEAILAALGASEGVPALPKGWLPRYAAARIAWHVLDHAWEIQDKSLPDDGK